MAAPTPADKGKRPWSPPRWFIRAAWAVHRAIYRWTGGRRGLWTPTEKTWGTFRLHTIGRTSGTERVAILAYHEDGANIVTVAMNGWLEGDPAWWLNLQARPETTIDLKGRSIRVRARAADGEERDRLWQLFPDAMPFVAHRKTPTAIVVLSPVADTTL